MHSRVESLLGLVKWERVKTKEMRIGKPAEESPTTAGKRRGGKDPGGVKMGRIARTNKSMNYARKGCKSTAPNPREDQEKKFTSNCHGKGKKGGVQESQDKKGGDIHRDPRDSNPRRSHPKGHRYPPIRSTRLIKQTPAQPSRGEEGEKAKQKNQRA